MESKFSASSTDRETCKFFSGASASLHHGLAAFSVTLIPSPYEHSQMDQ